MAGTKSSLSSRVLALLLLLATVAVPTAAQNTCNDASDNTLYDLICDGANNGDLSTLCTRINREPTLRNLLDNLPRTGTAQYTVFAPTNDAFATAGPAAGVTFDQQRWTIQYHVANGDLRLNNGLTCGGEIPMLLRAQGGLAYTTKTICNTAGDTQTEQQGNVLVGTPSLNGNAAAACNGRLYKLNNIMGFSPVINRWGTGRACDFFGPKSCKGTKGGRSIVVVREDADGNIIIVDNVFVPKSPKGGKGGWGWRAPPLALQQNVLFDWFGFGGYYGNKKGKGYYYYGPPGPLGPRVGPYGYYAPKKGKYGKRERRNLRASAAVTDRDRDILDVMDWGDGDRKAAADNFPGALSPYEADPYDLVEVGADADSFSDELAELSADETEQ